VTPQIPAQRQATPSSLTQPGARPAGSCTACGSTRLTSLSMTLTDGTTADFTSCHNCEARSWTAAGQPLSFADVIKRTTKVKASA
jgi:transcription elongation factor Elf1